MRLLHYLAHSPLGSVTLLDFRPRQFVLVGGVLKVTDLDDASVEETPCTPASPSDCLMEFPARNFTLPCHKGRCEGINEKRNLYNAYRCAFITCNLCQLVLICEMLKYFIFFIFYFFTDFSSPTCYLTVPPQHWDPSWTKSSTLQVSVISFRSALISAGNTGSYQPKLALVTGLRWYISPNSQK